MKLKIVNLKKKLNVAYYLAMHIIVIVIFYFFLTCALNLRRAPPTWYDISSLMMGNKVAKWQVSIQQLAHNNFLIKCHPTSLIHSFIWSVLLVHSEVTVWKKRQLHFPFDVDVIAPLVVALSDRCLHYWTQ